MLETEAPTPWDTLLDALYALAALFTSPARLLADHFTSGVAVSAFLMYIQRGEQAARAHIVAAAQRLAATISLSEPRPATRPASRDRVMRNQDPDTWRVSFALAQHVSTHTRHDAQAANRRRLILEERLNAYWYRPEHAYIPDRFDDLLARTSLAACVSRFEALLRVERAPEPFIRRAARRLARLARRADDQARRSWPAPSDDPHSPSEPPEPADADTS